MKVIAHRCFHCYYQAMRRHVFRNLDLHREAIEREGIAAHEWLSEHRWEIPQSLDTRTWGTANATIRPEIVEHDPTPASAVSLGPREPDSDDDLPTSDVPKWSEETIEVLMQVRGHWRLYSRLSDILPALEARATNVRHWSDDLRLHGPSIQLRQAPPTVRHIYGKPSSGVGKVDEITVLVRGEERTHAAAGFEADIDGTVKNPFQHSCDNWCVCYEPFQLVVEYAWTNPLTEELERWEKLPRTRLTRYFKNLLWEERQPEPQAPVVKWRPQYRRYYAEKETTNYYELDTDTDRPRYAKMWECWFRKGSESNTDFDEEDFSEAPGKIGARIAIDIIRIDAGYNVVKRRPAPLWERPDDRDDFRDVMKFLRCERATAFRYMKDGFRIPKKFKPTRAADLNDRASRQWTKIQNNVVHPPSGSTEVKPRDLERAAIICVDGDYKASHFFLFYGCNTRDDKPSGESPEELDVRVVRNECVGTPGLPLQTVTDKRGTRDNLWWYSFTRDMGLHIPRHSRSDVYSGCVPPSGCPNVGVVEAGEDG